ncbi:hypothetical protein [Rosenbergiella epipactidis]|uniref:hypothetical protein n=1 Tax=Rosenbergiella epipactidis TaxID=1544694 RepID=UPI001F4EFF4F|nr:hypothetical protein [Rosenbergiella epipactidis]
MPVASGHGRQVGLKAPLHCRQTTVEFHRSTYRSACQTRHSDIQQELGYYG